MRTLLLRSRMSRAHLPRSRCQVAAGIAVLCGLLLCAGMARAEKVPHLYRAAVPVATQSESDRSKGFRAALEQVLIKVSGLERLITGEQIVDRFPAPLGLVQTFGYRDNTDWLNYQSKRQNSSADSSSSVDGPSPSPAAPAQYLLEVTFAANLVDQQMQRLWLPVWGDTRPSILVWILVEQQGERQLIGNGDLYGLSDLLLQDAQRRGLPVFLPSADLQDLVAINMNDWAAMKPESVAEANLRYEPDAHVLLRIEQSGAEQWHADWRIVLKQESAPGQVRNSTLPGVVSVLGAELADYLSSRYAVLKTGGGQGDTSVGTELLFEVDRVNSFEDFIALQLHLENLPPLSSVAIEKIEGARVFCRVQLGGTRQQLLEHIELSGLMQLKPAPEVTVQPPQGSDPQAPLQAQIPVERFDWRGDVQSR